MAKTPSVLRVGVSFGRAIAVGAVPERHSLVKVWPTHGLVGTKATSKPFDAAKGGDQVPARNQEVRQLLAIRAQVGDPQVGVAVMILGPLALTAANHALATMGLAVSIPELGGVGVLVLVGMLLGLGRADKLEAIDKALKQHDVPARR